VKVSPLPPPPWGGDVEELDSLLVFRSLPIPASTDSIRIVGFKGEDTAGA
jgi:hypothetical protein